MKTEAMLTEAVEQKIFMVRGYKVMLDKDLARLYGITTFNLNKAVTRNLTRFPEDCVPRTYAERRFSLSSMVLCKR